MSLRPIPVRFRLDSTAEAATPPSCPDYGFPRVPASNRPNRCVEPWIAVYDAECTPQAIECLLFRRRHYAWRQTRLVALLHRRPPADAAAVAKYEWCAEIVRLVIDLADDTNVAHHFLSGFGVEDHFSHTRAHVQSLLPGFNGRVVPTIYPELWFTGHGDESVAPNRPVIGYYVLGHLEGIDHWRSAYLVMPPGRTGSIMLEHVRAAHALERPRPIPNRWRRGSGVGGGTPSPIDRAALRAALTQGRGVSARDLSIALFATAPDDFQVGSIERATGGAPCLAGPADRECFHYERFPVAIAGAKATMDLLEAHARDWIETPFDVVLNRGYRRYLTYLTPYAEAGTLGLTPEELLEQTLVAERLEAQAMSDTAFGVVAGVATAINPIIGGIIALIGAAIHMLLEFVPLASGDGDCPRLGFRRMLTDPECAVPTPQGNTNIVGLLDEYMTRVAADPATRAGGGGEQDDRRDRDEDEGGVPVVGLLGVAALAALGIGVLAKRRSDRRSEQTEGERP